MQQLALSPDSKTLVSVGNSQGGKLTAWEWKQNVENNNKLEYCLQKNKNEVIQTFIHSLILSDDKRYACYSSSKDVFIWDNQSDENPHQVALEKNSALESIQKVVVTPDFKMLFVADHKYTEVHCLVDDTRRYRFAQRLPRPDLLTLDPDDSPQSVLVSRDGNTVLVCGSNNNDQIMWKKPPKLEKISTVQNTYKLTEHSGKEIKVLSMSEDQLSLLRLSSNGLPIIYERGLVQEQFRREQLDVLDPYVLDKDPRGVIRKKNKEDSTTIVIEVIKKATKEKLILILRRNNPGEGIVLLDLLLLEDRFEIIKTITSIGGEAKDYFAPQITADSKLIAYWSSTNSVNFLKLNGNRNYQENGVLGDWNDRILSLKFNWAGFDQKDFLLALGSEDCKLIIWKRKSTSSTKFSILQENDLKNRKIRYIEFSQDSELLVLGTDNNDLYVLKWKPSASKYHLFQSLGVAKNSKNRSISLSRDGSILLRTEPFEIYGRNGKDFKLAAKYIQSPESPSIATQTDSEYIVGNKKGEIKVLTKKHSNFFASFLTDYYYSTVLIEAFQKDSLESTIEYLLKHAFTIVEPSEGFYGNDYELGRMSCLLNPLFWLSAFDFPKLLNKLLNEKDYPTFHYDDWVYQENQGHEGNQTKKRKSEEYDPFVIALMKHDDELLDVWANYFKNNPERLVIRNDKMLDRLLGSSNSKIQNLALKKLISEPKPDRLWIEIDPKSGGTDNSVNGQPRLGDGVDLLKKYSLKGKGFEYEAVDDHEWNMTLDIKKKLIDKQDTNKPAQEVSTKATSISIPQNLGDNYDLIESVKKMDSDKKLEIRPLIMSLYAENWHYFLLYSLVSALGGLLLFTIVIFRQQQWPLQVAFYTIYFLMILYEAADFSQEKWEYFKDVYNWFDIILYPFGIILVILVTTFGYEFLADKGYNSLVVLLLNIALIRMVSMLRVFDSTRYFIQIVLTSLTGMVPFMIFFAVYVIGTGGFTWS